MSGRVHWIDVAKGILIILMVINHIPNIANRCGVEMSYLRLYHIPAQIYTCFFMQAFFILSGFTTNFSKPQNKYLIGLIKGIIIPWFSFATICDVIPYYLKYNTVFTNIDGVPYLIWLESYWFLSALFFSKLSYYFLKCTIKNRWTIFTILLVFMIIGFGINFHYNNNCDGLSDPSHYKNYLHYRNFMCMALFIWIGDNIKDMFECKFAEKLMKWSVGTFICFIMVYYIARFAHSDCILLQKIGYSHGTGLRSYYQIPLFIFYTTVGTISFLFLIKRYINRNTIIEYLGKNSIIVYCTHFSILWIVIPILQWGD